jgi:hypothetical protein
MNNLAASAVLGLTAVPPTPNHNCNGDAALPPVVVKPPARGVRGTVMVLLVLLWSLTAATAVQPALHAAPAQDAR